MKKILLIFLVALMLPVMSFGATEQAKQVAIDAGLAWLSSTQNSDGHWDYQNNDGDLAATASAVLAFIEEGYLPNSTGTTYEQQVDKALDYIFQQADIVDISNQQLGHPEDYNNDGTSDGNGKGIYFDPRLDAYNKRDVYTTGLVAPVIYALGEALGKDTVVGKGTVTGMTYSQVMQDVIDWFSYGQNDPSTGNHRGGWRYTDNYGTSDNSTAQWGALPMIYGEAWGLGTPDFVKTELETYIDYIQHPQDGTYRAGGSGYTNPDEYVNPSKTGGLMLELAAIGADSSDARLLNAIGYLNSTVSYDHWNQYATTVSGQWYGGNLNNPYAMWAVYKALETWGYTTMNDNGTADTADDFLVGFGISNAPGGITIGQDWDPQISLAGDWYSHYSDVLVNLQNANGSWNGYAYWTGALSAGWYINILNAAGAPPPQEDPVPEPGTFVLFGIGLLGLTGMYRRKKT